MLYFEMLRSSAVIVSCAINRMYEEPVRTRAHAFVDQMLVCTADQVINYTRSALRERRLTPDQLNDVLALCVRNGLRVVKSETPRGALPQFDLERLLASATGPIAQHGLRRFRLALHNMRVI